MGVGAASVFHKTRLSDIPRQRLHKAIHCLASAQPTDRPPQSSRKIGLREAGRLAEPLRSFGPPPLAGEASKRRALGSRFIRLPWKGSWRALQGRD